MILINGSFFVVLGVLIYLIVRSIFIGWQYRNQVQIYWLKEILKLVFGIYICLVISVTLFPIPIGFENDYKNLFRSINVVPIVSIIRDISQIGTAYEGDVYFMISLIVRNVGGNILLFMPFGFLVPIVSKKIKDLKTVTILGLAMSVTIELFQLLQSFGGGWGRVTDIDDVICNVIGVVLGYLIYVLIIKTGEKFKIKALD
ncbi:VanZ family protein [Bacillus sp. FJAT-27445]|uniref:VanZ family protein n=1 Tax=Bacillus sp. FJAT-27445 TaxID=1679166 RepID=UPI0007439204|nr:VanZ family protein [Bacillus sp. FJAT-27445]